MKKLIKELYLYIKYRHDINFYYGWSYNEGYVQDETYTWRQRLNYWLKAE